MELQVISILTKHHSTTTHFMCNKLNNTSLRILNSGMGICCSLAIYEGLHQDSQEDFLTYLNLTNSYKN